MVIDINAVLANLDLLALAFVRTIWVSVAGFCGAIVVAFLLWLLRRSGGRIGLIIHIGYVEVARGIPLPILFLWIYYALPILSGYDLSPWLTGVAGIALQIGAYLVDDYVGAESTIPSGQSESSRSLGVSKFATYRRIILPQAVKIAMPNIVNSLIFAIKGSALLVVISYPELMYTGQKIAGYTFRPFEVLTVVALFYFALSALAAMIGRRIERHLGRHELVRTTRKGTRATAKLSGA